LFWIIVFLFFYKINKEESELTNLAIKDDEIIIERRRYSRREVLKYEIDWLE
jgi:hypothetical protein